MKTHINIVVGLCNVKMPFINFNIKQNVMPSYQKLQQELKFEQALPVTEDWSAAVDFLAVIKNYCMTEKPVNIVECSSGLTTLILSKCCQINSIGHVYSLENGEEYQQLTQEHLKQFNLQNYANVNYAPLMKHTINNVSYEWYQPESVKKIKIDMLVIDGPPGFIQKHSRYPALPILFNQLAKGACVFLDDAGRDEEKEIVAMWLNQYSDLKHEYLETERGCSILKLIK